MKKSLKISIVSTLSGLSLMVTALSASAVFAAAGGPPPPPPPPAGCSYTDFYKDGIHMTAAIVNPTTTVTGNVNGTPCNIGVYYGPGTRGLVNFANVYGSNYYGIVVRQANVTVENTNVHNIGEMPFNGTQHGTAIYYATVSTGSAVVQPDCTGGSTQGTVQQNTVSAYQKGGIVVNCTGTNVTVQNNNVTGLGRVNYIAQNGIQFGYGSRGAVSNNTVSNNDYTGPNGASSGGILIFGGCGGTALVTNLMVQNNTTVNNDVGIWVYESDSGCGNASPTATHINIQNNTVSNNAVTNTTGNSPTQGYQAGISDFGNGDTIQNNNVSGLGYQAQNTASEFVAPIDTAGSLNVHSMNNFVH